MFTRAKRARGLLPTHLDPLKQKPSVKRDNPVDFAIISEDTPGSSAEQDSPDIIRIYPEEEEPDVNIFENNELTEKLLRFAFGDSNYEEMRNMVSDPDKPTFPTPHTKEKQHSNPSYSSHGEDEDVGLAASILDDEDLKWLTDPVY